MNTPQKYSKVAVAAFVLGILTCCLIPFFAPLAVVLGHIGRFTIRKNPDLKGGGLALAGLIIGYIWLALLVIVVAWIYYEEAQGRNPFA